MGVPAISYRATVNEYYDYGFYYLPNRLSHQCFDFEELRLALGKILAGELGAADGEERKELVDRHLAGQVGPLACERMLDVLEGIMEGKTALSPPSVRNRLEGLSMSAVRTLIKRSKELLPGSHNRPEFQRHRYPEVPFEEVRRQAFRLQQIVGNSKELRVEQISGQFFRISG
jgi:hypothetical protein